MVLQHSLSCRVKSSMAKKTYSMRRRCLDHKTGQKAFDFDENIETMRENIKEGRKVYFNEFTHKIYYKRTKSDDTYLKDSQTVTDDTEIYKLLPDVIEQLQQINSEFISGLNAIKNGHILKNIALHLLLDIGTCYSHLLFRKFIL